MVELNEKAVEAAINAYDTRHDPSKYATTVQDYGLQESARKRVQMSAAITAYLSALPAPDDGLEVADESDIALAVMTWMIENGWLDDGHEYHASDIVAALNDNAGPGAGYVVSDEMVEVARNAFIAATGGHIFPLPSSIRAALTAALGGGE